jgi:hypothetical protein
VTCQVKFQVGEVGEKRSGVEPGDVADLLSRATDAAVVTEERPRSRRAKAESEPEAPSEGEGGSAE